MRPRTLLLLALLVAGLGAFIWLFERDMPSTDDRRELESRLLPVEVDDVKVVIVERDGGSIRLERGDESDESTDREWRLTEPLVSRADGGDVRSLLSTLTGLEKKRELSEVALSEVGLETPRLQLTIATAGNTWLLSVGSEVPATDDIVVAVEGRGAFVTSGRFVEELEREPGEWRARDIVAGDADDIQAIRSTVSAGDLVLVRQDGRFVLEEPVRDIADEEMVTELLTALTGLEVDRFLDDESVASNLGLDPPDYEIAVTLEGREEPLVVRIGALAPEGNLRFGEAENQRFTVETDLAAILDRPHQLWQSRDWTDLEPFEIDSVRLTVQGVEAELARVDGEWRRDSEAIPYSVARDLLDSITDVRAERVLSGVVGTAGGDAQSLSLVIVAADSTETLRLWPSGDGAFLAAREGRGYALEVASETAEAVMAAVEAVRDVAPEVDSDPEPVSDG